MPCTLPGPSYIPQCCGVRLEPRQPKTYCRDCGNVYDYLQLRAEMLAMRGAVASGMKVKS